MQKNDFSLSSDAIIGSSNLEDVQIDSAFLESSDSLSKITVSTPTKASTDLQQIILTKLQEISKQNLDAGFIDQALEGYKRCADQLKNNLSGDINSPTYIKFLYDNLSYLNETALKYLQVSSIDDAVKILNKCLEIAHPEPYRAHPDLQSLTYNHLGCCYRRLGNLEQALYCLQKALHYHERAIETGIQGKYMESSSVTHVNFCAILSQKGRHQEALEHAKKAVADCTRDLFQLQAYKSDPSKQTLIKKKAVLLAIAYYNLGVEDAFCHNPEPALESHSRAYQIAEEYNGPEDPITLRFQKAYNELKAKRKSSPVKIAVTSAINLPVSSMNRSRPIIRPRSAQTTIQTSVSSARLEFIASPKGSANGTPFSQSSNQRFHIPKTLLSSTVRLNSPESSLSTTPKILSRPGSGMPTRRVAKVTTPTAVNAKFFFPMGGMAPFIDPTRISKTQKAQEAKKIQIPQKPQKPQRPMTANSQLNTSQGRRISRPTIRMLSPSGTVISPMVSPKEAAEISENQKKHIAYRNYMANQDEALEELGVGADEPRVSSAKQLTRFKENITPKPHNQYTTTMASQRGESTKYTINNFDYSEEPMSVPRRASVGSLSTRKVMEDEIKEIQKAVSKEILSSRPKKKVDNGRYKKLALLVQAHWKGYCCRKKLNRLYKGLYPIHYWAVPCRIITKALERQDKSDEYLVVMTYSCEEKIIYVYVKNLYTKALYKKRIGNVLEKKQFTNVCLNMLQTIGMENGRLHFQAKVPVEDVIKDEVIEKISEKSEESDVGPLIEALEKEANISLGEIGKDITGESQLKTPEEIIIEEDKSGFDRLETVETQDEALKIEETPKMRLEFQQTNSKSELSSPGGNFGDESSTNQKGMRRSNTLRVEHSFSEVDDAHGKESRYILFSKRVMLKGNVVTLRLESSKVRNKTAKLFLSCYVTSKPQRVEVLELPSHLADKRTPTVEEVLEVITIDFNPFRLSLKNPKPEVKPDNSFSSYNDASIALDLSAHHTEGPMILRSESLRKQTSPEDRLGSPDKEYQKLFRGFSSSMVEYRTDKEHTNFLTKGKWKSKLDEQKRSAFGNRPFDFAAAKDISIVDKANDARKGKKDSRTTLSQGEFTQRSEAEGSIMLRVAEGYILYCRVAHKRGENEAVVKYSTNSEEAGRVEEVRINLEELALDPVDVDKDVLMDKVRGILGKRMKVRRGELVYEKPKLSRNGTLVIKDDEKVSSRVSSREEIENKKEREIFLTMKKIEEVEENTRREEGSAMHLIAKEGQISNIKSSPSIDKLDSKRTGGSGSAKGSSPKIVSVPKVDHDSARAASAELKIVKRISAGSGGQVKPEIRIRLEENTDTARKDASFGNQQDTSILSSHRTDGLPSSPTKLTERLGDYPVNKNFIETFGALHSSEESFNVEKTAKRKPTDIKINIVDASAQQLTRSTTGQAQTIALPRAESQDFLGSPRNLTKKQNTPRSKLTIKPSQQKVLKPPEPKKLEDSSPKVKNTLTVKTNPLVKIIGADSDDEQGSSGVWSFIVNGSEQHISGSVASSLAGSPILERSENNGGNTDRGKDVKNGIRNYAGDIPKIIIHREVENTHGSDSKYFSKSLGTLDHKPPKEKKVQTATPKVSSMALSHNDDDYDGQKDWATKREKSSLKNEDSSSRASSKRPSNQSLREKHSEDIEAIPRQNSNKSSGHEKKKKSLKY